MNSISSLLGTLGGALSAQQAELNVTGQNINNVNTPGYVRQSVTLQTQLQGGVMVSGIQRSFNAFTFGQVLTEVGMQSQANARSSSLAAAQSMLAPQGGGGVADTLNAFFTSLQTLSASPSDPSARSAVLSSATQLASSFATTASRLGQQQASLLTQAQGVATQVNQDLSQIAQLNKEIVQTKASGGDTTSMETQRDSMATDVANQMGAKVIPDPSGSISLSSAGGTLVTGNTASTVSVGLDSAGAMQILVTSGGGAPVDVTANTNDGTLGGLREARDVTIAQAANQLDQVAYNVGKAVNTLQQSGYGLDGLTGRPLFAPRAGVAGAAAAMQVDPSVAGNPSAIAASSTPGGLPGGNDIAQQLAALVDQPLGGAGTAAQQVGLMTSQLGSAKSAADTDAATRADTVTQAQNLNSSASGVSLNEEMVNLTTYQQAFEATTHVLQVVGGLLGNFINGMNP